MTRRSAPFSSIRVAALCLKACGLTRFLMPARVTHLWMVLGTEATMTANQNAERFLIDVKQLTAELQRSLPKRIDAAVLGLPSKIPFKAISLREGLIHRASDLSGLACELYERRRIVPAIIMVRAVMETVAMLYFLYWRIDQVLTSQELGDIDQFLMRGIFGWRDDTMPMQPLNVLTAIDRVDKQFEGYRGLYDELSEFAHPNWSGASGAYANLIQNKYAVELGTECSTLDLRTGLPAFRASLECFRYYYNLLSDIMPSFVEFCHAEAVKNPR
jgi:hypothetical protein